MQDFPIANFFNRGMYFRWEENRHFSRRVVQKLSSAFYLRCLLPRCVLFKLRKGKIESRDKKIALMLKFMKNTVKGACTHFQGSACGGNTKDKSKTHRRIVSPFPLFKFEASGLWGLKFLNRMKRKNKDHRVSTANVRSLVFPSPVFSRAGNLFLSLFCIRFLLFFFRKHSKKSSRVAGRRAVLPAYVHFGERVIFYCLIWLGISNGIEDVSGLEMKGARLYLAFMSDLFSPLFYPLPFSPP